MKPRLLKACYWILRVWLCACALLAIALPAHAQFIGYTSPQTTQQIVFTNQTTSSTFLLQNIGQSIHYLSYSTIPISGEPCVMNIRLEASFTGGSTTWFPISEDGADPIAFGSGATGLSGASPGLVASGSFPQMRVNLTIPVLTTPAGANACSVSAAYSGTSTTNGTIEQGFIQSNGFRKMVALGEAPGTISRLVAAPYGSTAGRIYLVCYPACGAGMTFNIIPTSIPVADGYGDSPVLQTITAANTGTIQEFDITPVPAETVFLLNTGAGTATYVVMYYQFIPETNVGNTVNVNCVTGCSGGGGGSNVVWGPNAIGIAPTEPPVQVGGLNPSGTVAEFQSDAAGNQTAVGPTATGSAVATNPVQVAGEIAGSGNVSPPFQTDLAGDQQVVGVVGAGSPATGINPILIGSIDGSNRSQFATNDGSSTHDINVNIANQTLATGVLTAPAAAIQTNGTIPSSGGGISCVPLVPQPFGNFVQSATISVQGTWTGTLDFEASAPSLTSPFVSVNVYPILTGSGFGAPVSSTTANGNWLVPAAGINQVEVCGATVATGTADVTITPTGENNPIIAVQPTASNLNATVVCASGCLPAGGSNIVWGPNAVGVAPTEPPVLTGGKNPSGNVETVETDAIGNLIAVGPTAVGVSPTTNPVLLGAVDQGSGHVAALKTLAGTPALLVSAVNSFVGTSSPAADVINLPVGVTSSVTAISGTACATLGGGNPPGVQESNAVVVYIPAFTGTITFNVLPVTGGVLQPITAYPYTASGPGNPGVTSTTTGGIWIIYGAASNEYEVCGASITGASVAVTIFSSPSSNATYALQPIAANLHARTEPNAAPSSACTPVVVNFSSSGNNTIVAGVSGQQVRIYALNVVFGGAATVTFEDGASTPLTGPMGIFSGGSINLANEGAPQFITSTGNAFNINLSAGVQGSGWGCYSQF